MDEVRTITDLQDLILYIDQAKENLSPDFLLIILGPTASGKTRLAVELARKMNGEIISADSRQVYKQLDIGTGKDLADYQEIPYHLIDIIDAKDRYDVNQFKIDFRERYQQIVRENKQAILCGGSGSYIQSLLQEQAYNQVPKDASLQAQLATLSKTELIQEIQTYSIPKDFNIDWNSHKRLVRALEILQYLAHNPSPPLQKPIVSDYLIIGLHPNLEKRRSLIDLRLNKRIEEGLLEEVKGLIEDGLSHEELQWFGLEYKYASQYLLGELDLERFKEKLRTEIHRFAKRQMTYFRKMEKDGIPIYWINRV